MSYERSPTDHIRNPPPAEAVVAALAARRRGLVKIGQLLALGVTRTMIRNWVARGLLHRVRRGVYAVGHRAPSREATFLAAVFGGGEGALLTGVAATELRGLVRYRACLIDVVVLGQRRERTGVRFHRTKTLDPRDVTSFQGIPITTTPRMFVDLTEVQTPFELANVVHEAAYRGWFSEQATRDAMARANGRHNLHVLEEALALNADGSAGLKSRNEAAFLQMLQFAQLPDPKVNTHLAGEEVDFHWPQLKLAIEIDGPGHTRPRTQREDRAKQRKWQAAGYEVLRFADLDQRVIETLRTYASRAAS